MVAKVRKSKKVVTVALVRDAVVALSERNGSNVKSIFNYLVWKRQANSGARKQAILALRKAVKSGVLAKRGKAYVVPQNHLASKPSRGSEKHEKMRLRRRESMSSEQLPRLRRFRGEEKNSSTSVCQSSKKVQTSLSTRSQKAKLNPKDANVKSGPKILTRPRRKRVIIVRYTA